MNYDIRIEDDAGNAYYPHGHAKTNFMSDGKDVETAIGQITLQKSENKVIVFNLDGSITETIQNGNTVLRTKVTTFPSSTEIVETTTGDGVITVKTTTFNSDGTIKEEVI